MYRLQLTATEPRVLRSLLTKRLAALGSMSEEYRSRRRSTLISECEEIAVLTRLLTQIAQWEGQSASVRADLSPEELSVMSDSLRHPTYSLRVTADHPDAVPALKSLRSKVDQAARPPLWPLSALVKLLS